MRYIIHDWPDDDALRILKNIRDAMSSESRLLICDRIILPTYRTHTVDDDEAAPHPLLANWADSASSGADLLMMTNFNAKERTKEEFQKLVGDAGLKIENLWYGNGTLGILECSRLK
jgi:O-methyltransferase domain